jgi:aminopeptidase
MPDPRIQEYARLLVERCVNVQQGWQVVVQSTPLARPLVEEVARLIGRRGAYPIINLTYPSFQSAWAQEAPEEILAKLPSITVHKFETMDALISIEAPENTRDRTDIPPERNALLARASAPLLKRIAGLEVPWVGCQFPTPALAQDAGMTLSAFEDFLYGACLLDWDEEGRKMNRIKERFERADEVRIVGDGTDIRMSIKGRPGRIDDGHVNMPGGEVFFSPIEESVEGVVTFSEFPACYQGHAVEGVRLVFREGRVVEASASRGEEFLLKTLDTDPGARVLGELGIGCNPGIQRHMMNTLFDEKIYGTIHLAVGAGFSFIGGKNVSAVHWDMVKDLRSGGRIYLDGELVQEDGRWLF